MDKASVINTCRGTSGGCRFALHVDEDFAERLEKVIEESGWPEFLHQKFGEKVNRHKLVNVSAASCPNGCSRPHIADIGLIRACVPVIDHEGCIGCEECIRNCPDEAMEMVDGKVVITREKCLVCGYCTNVCPTEVISCSRSGWRFLVGGRLGRHPRLGMELPGVYSDDEVLELISRCMKLWMDNYVDGKRFGWVMDRVGHDKILLES
ncbi:4Fe-4S dicluster domain-containing protein [Maridesulfovibrio salexigens]|uniref:Nitrite and sulphite reductase 4Fe-4S region n=1 Tax=Maridesulfovibrio salexigens (strain ATCC 14822 / DSM 2638 / NCIMB 8403 / VKM B-1763) TaxID=526222 RepID=C6C033_MARSD|nr:4Fe-4S binding protein [Maridesulfovibrio salexigens]ACS80904.1 nitrite and sulphite reductase 4Fe-4S region [Maridesulfovibrio salexigens DSM 2638]